MFFSGLTSSSNFCFPSAENAVDKTSSARSLSFLCIRVELKSGEHEGKWFGKKKEGNGEETEILSGGREIEAWDVAESS